MADAPAVAQYAHVQPGVLLFVRKTANPFVLAKIKTVDRNRRRCYVQFEDGTLHWCLFHNLQNTSVPENVCCLCSSVGSQPLIVCRTCHLGFHRSCHNPVVNVDEVPVGAIWKCSLCICKSYCEETTPKLKTGKRKASREDSDSAYPLAKRIKRVECRSTLKPKSTEPPSNTDVPLTNSSFKLASCVSTDTLDTASLSDDVSPSDNDDVVPISDEDDVVKSHSSGSGEQEYDSDASNFKSIFINSVSASKITGPSRPPYGKIPTAKIASMETSNIISESEPVSDVPTEESIKNALRLSKKNYSKVREGTADVSVVSLKLSKKNYQRASGSKTHNNISLNSSLVSSETASVELGATTVEVYHSIVVSDGETYNSQPSRKEKANVSNDSTFFKRVPHLSKVDGRKKNPSMQRYWKNRNGKKEKTASVVNQPIPAEFLGVDVINSLTHPKNVVDKSRIEATCQKKVSAKRLKVAVSNYFGSLSRLTNGVGCRVIGHRVDGNGKVQYLVEWDAGIIV